MDRSA